MELTEEQKKKVAEWVEEGCKLSEIQRRLRDQLGVSLTYMDTRFLILDLGLTLYEEQPEPVAEELEPGPASVPAPETAAGLGGGVSVGIDRVVKPGSMISGTVTFSDGVSGSWMIDQMGRVGLDTGTPGYAPSEADLESFQMELRSALEAKGM